MSLYLLDTQIVSYAWKNDPRAELYDDVLTSSSKLFISLQTRAEMVYGARWAKWSAKRLAELEAVLAKFRLLEPDADVADIYGELVAESRRGGRSLATGDAWIAATAIYYEIPLVTHDKDFLPFPGLSLIRRSLAPA